MTGHPKNDAGGARAAEPPQANPYLSAAAPPGPMPDLDSAAPELRPIEARRVNRKAVGFLVGIVLFLALMTMWMVHSATASRDKRPRPREEAVAVPELPRTPQAVPASAGEVAAQPDVAPLPLLPPPPAASVRTTSTAPPVAPPQPSLMERRMGASAAAMDADARAAASDPVAQGLLGGLAGLGAAPAAPAAGSAPPGVQASFAQPLRRPDALLARGTYIRCILESRIVTDLAGFASCVVTEPVYSINGRRLLLPRGSKISGRYQGEPTGPRVAVVWDRIITPEGNEVTMASPGVDGLGSAGHPGDYDAHWGSRMGAALMVSMISDGFRYAAAEYGPATTTVSGGIVTQSPFESTTAHAMERLANQALSKAANRPATVTIPQGALLNVYVAADVDFSEVPVR